MTIEVTSATIKNSIVTITALDVSEEHFQWIQRTRDDGFEKEIEYTFDTRDPKHRNYLYWFLKHQRNARGATTWGDAIHSIIGTIIESPIGKYRVWA